MIDRGTCKAMLRESARLMLEQADRLSDIDSKFGDGDHGITITKIAKLMDERAEAWDEESIKDFLDDLGMAAMAVRGATHPQTGTLLAELGDDEMEIGMGQHGEEGGGRQPMKSADETAAIMVNALAKDIGIQPGEKVMLIVNGSGATTLMEQLIVYRAAVKELAKQDIEVVANFVGEMLTVQEQAGFQMFMARMDDELLRLWNAPCNTPYLKK